MKSKGKLVCVGTGMKLGADLTPIAKKYIEQSDVVFSCVSSGIVELWLEGLNSNFVSLQPLYKEGKSRLKTYKEMVDTILSSVSTGKNVCAAFYGHPGVFAWVAHKAIANAKQAGYFAKMIPGLSAEDYLYADLSIDPGRFGCQHYEASQLLLRKKEIDNSSFLIIWQIGVVGDKSLKKFKTGSKYREVFVKLLSNLYTLEHEIILYETAVLPIEETRVEKISISELIDAEVSLKTTIVIPPIKESLENINYQEQLKKVEQLANL